LTTHTQTLYPPNRKKFDHSNYIPTKKVFVNQTKTTSFLAKCTLILASICCATHSCEIHSSGLQKKLTAKVKSPNFPTYWLEGYLNWEIKNKDREKKKTSCFSPEDNRPETEEDRKKIEKWNKLCRQVEKESPFCIE